MPELVDVTPGSPEWQAARRRGITATDIVTITGLSATDSAYALYWRKLGILPEAGDTDRWRLGRELEPYIAKRWREAGTVGLDNLYGGALWRSDERPWQMATIDRGLVGDDATEPVELKSWADADRARWDNGPPAAVQVQVLWQMDVMGVATGHVGVLFLPSGEFRSHTIEHAANEMEPVPEHYSCQTCEDIAALRDAGREFMDRLTNPEMGPPSPDGSAATLAALKARHANPVNDKTAPVLSDLWGAYEYHLDMAAKHKAKAKEGEALIREEIGDAGIIEVDGEIVARRTISTIRAHYRKEGRRDVITRIKVKEDDNGAE